ncbi:MAG: carbohydrate kinase family protein [Eubacteriales bacterium]|nr:carbohydrate kinase family protein [Eubacteriales bacterium]
MDNRFSIIGAAHLDALVEGIDEGQLRLGSAPADQIHLGYGGDALNEAITLTRLGANVDLISKIGLDSAGDMVLSFCRASGLSTAHIAREDRLSTSMNIVLIDHAGERRFITDPKSSLRALSLSDVMPHLDSLAPVVCFASLFVFPHFRAEELATLFFAIKQRGCVLAADMTKRKNGEKLADLANVWPYLDIVFANAEEAGLLCDSTDVYAMAQAFRHAGVGCIVIKTGASGCFVGSDAFTGAVAGCVSRACVDTTGAGDNFAAAFLYARAAGRTPDDCARYANAVASICVEHLGATTHVITPDEALARCRENYGEGFGAL